MPPSLHVLCRLDQGKGDSCCNPDSHNSLVFKLQHQSGKMVGLLCVLSTMILCETLGEPLNLLEFILLDLPDSNVLRIKNKLNNSCQAQNPVCTALKSRLFASFNSQGASRLLGEPRLDSVHIVGFVGPQGKGLRNRVCRKVTPAPQSPSVWISFLLQT